MEIGAEILTLLKQEDDKATNSEKNFVKKKEMSKTHPKQSLACDSLQSFPTPTPTPTQFEKPHNSRTKVDLSDRHS